MRIFTLLVLLEVMLGVGFVNGQCEFPATLINKVEARFEGDQYLAFDGDTTTYDQWTDLSGNDHHFLSSASPEEKPIHISDVINGHGALFVDGDDEMLMSDDVNVQSAFVIYSWDGDTPFDDFKGLLVRPTGPGSFRLFFGQNGETAFWPSGFFTNNFATNGIVGMEIPNLNSLNATYAFRNDLETLSGLLLGRDFSAGNRYWEGKVVQLILFNQALTEAELADLKEYVNCNYTPLPDVPDTITTSTYCPIQLDFERDYFTHYEWNTGDTTPVISISSSGLYEVEVATIFGDTMNTQVEVIFPGTFIDDFTLCAGQDSIWDTGLETFDLMWQDGSELSSFEIDDAGSYFVTITDTAGCSFTSDTVDVILDDFSNELSITLPDIFCTGNPLQAAGNGTQIESYIWSTNENSSSIIPEGEGEYWLTAENVNGCVGQDTVDVIFDGEAPVVGYVSDPICVGTSVAFADTSTSEGGEIVSVTWYIGEGSLTGPEVDYTFNFPGNVYFSLQVETDAGCTAELTDSLFVNPLPVIEFETSLACSGQSTLFNDLSTVQGGVISDWLWNFGGSDISTEQETEYSFNNPGNQPVVLAVTSNAGCVVDSSFSVPVNPSPAADFTWSPTCAGALMSFESQADTGLTGPLNYAWNFNGVAASGANPQHLFPGAGSYTVTHEVWTTINGMPGCFDEVLSDVVVSAPPEVQFNNSPACGDQPFALTDQSVSGQNDSIVSWLWTSLGALIGTTQNTTYAFDELGTYPVSLEVETMAGCSGETTQWVEVGSSQPPEIAFNPIIGLPPLEVSFTNLNSYGQSHSWEFGDGDISILENPVHTYLDTGIYTVQLFVLDEAGCAGLDTASVLVIEPYYDVSIESVSCSLDDGQLQVSCVLGNYNNHRLSSAVLSMRLGNGTTVNELWQGELDKNQLATYSFESQLIFDPEINEPYVCVTIGQPNGALVDAVPENNEQCKPIGESGFEMLNPFPNPVEESINQWFVLETRTNVTIRIVESDGKIVFEREEIFGPGLNRFEFDTRNLRAGVYLISLQTSGESKWNRFLKLKPQD